MSSEKLVVGVPPALVHAHRKTEKILRLTAGEDAPPGMEIVRIEGTCESEDADLVYVVAVKHRPAGTFEDAFRALELAMKVEDGTADSPDVEALVRACRVLARGMMA